MIGFKNFLEASSIDEELGPLKLHAKWDQNRYERMKLNGLEHGQIKKVWDDEVNAEKMADQMKNAANKVKK